MLIIRLAFAAVVLAIVAGAAYFLSARPARERAAVSPGSPGPPGAEEFGLTKAELVQRIEAAEQGIANCMNAAGFQYVPVDYLTVRKSMDADKKVAGLTDEEFREQFGYGVATRPIVPGAPPQLSGADHAVTIGLGSENTRIFNRLSASDRAAYNRSLLGENTAATFAVALEAEDFSPTGGCTRTAIERVFASDQLSPAYRNPGDALIAQDQRVITATAKWADCMRGSGFDYHLPEDVGPDLQDRLNAITGGGDARTLAPEAQRALTELQGRERAIAVADFECAEKLIEPVVRQIETELYGAPQN